MADLHAQDVERIRRTADDRDRYARLLRAARDELAACRERERALQEVLDERDAVYAECLERERALRAEIVLLEVALDESREWERELWEAARALVEMDTYDMVDTETGGTTDNWYADSRPSSTLIDAIDALRKALAETPEPPANREP